MDVVGDVVGGTMTVGVEITAAEGEAV